MLFHSDAYGKMLDGVNKASYVGEETIDGVKCDHVRLERDDFDFDLWSVVPAEGSKPVLRRVKPDMTRQIQRIAERPPEMKDAKIEATVDVKDWKIDQPAAEKFAFAAPCGVERSNRWKCSSAAMSRR